MKPRGVDTYESGNIGLAVKLESCLTGHQAAAASSAPVVEHSIAGGSAFGSAQSLQRSEHEANSKTLASCSNARLSHAA